MLGLEDDQRIIRELVKWSGDRPAAIARSIGAANTTINRPFRGTATTRISTPTWEKLKAAYPGFPEWATNQAPEANAIPFKMEGAPLRRMRQDLPVWGTALGAARIIEGEAVEQTMLNQGEVVRYAKRPILLDGNTSAYGLYIQGSSMDPAYLDGDLIIADSKHALRIGDDVVVYLRPLGEEDDGERARAVLIKRLVRRTASYIELRQFQPEITFRIEAREVLRMDRVLRLPDLID